MRSNTFKSILIKSGLAASVLLLAGGAAFAQQAVNLTAGGATATLPDGTTVPMWGYSCGAVVAGSGATCAKLNPAATGWSPVVITIPTTATGGLQINLVNHLAFGPAGANKIPTSLVIVGQLGAGLGTTATSKASPDHSAAQSTVTWPIVGSGNGTPPIQGARVQSFSTEVAATAVTVTTPAALTWPTLRPGTYLIESGTHPSIQGPMGLYGILVVTTAPVGTTAGTAYPAVGTTPAVTYSAEVPLLLSEIDPIQNNAVQAAVAKSGFNETKVWSGQPGGCGNPASGAVYQTCYPPAVNYIPLYYLFNGVAFDKTHASASLFPALPGTAAAPITGNVLVRFVNAGLRMHVPSIVGAQTGVAVAPQTSPPSGFSLIAEDGNPLPGATRVQSEVFLAAGKTFDVMVNAPAATAAALPVFDRELSLSGNAIGRDTGMLAYIGINGSAVAATAAAASTPVARPDTYNALLMGQTLTVSDPAHGLIANDTNVYGVKLLSGPTGGGTLNLKADGTFTFTPAAGSTSDSFTYCANGTVTAGVCSSGLTATVTLAGAVVEAASGITVKPITYTSNVATTLSIKAPGVLSVDSDAAGYPLTVGAGSVVPQSGLTVSVDKSGAFNASVATPGTYTFTYTAQNSQGTRSAAATVTLIFPTGNGPVVRVIDGKDKVTDLSGDYRWVIEEDRTFYVDPTKTTNTGTTVVPTFGTNFHTSYMPLVAQGCVGLLSCEAGQTIAGSAVVCDVADGACRPGDQKAQLLPSQVHLDSTKRYYLTVLPGSGADALTNPDNPNAHGMGGVPIPAACTPVAPATTCTGTLPALTVFVQPTPFPTANLSVFVFEDDQPLNGENDAGGGALGGGDVGIAANEPGLSGFNITLFDDAGGSGDATGQMTYDMFNMPLTNSLDGTIDPATGRNACPISKGVAQGTADANGVPANGITGTIVTCPRYEDDGITFSPLAGQALVNNLMPGRYGVVATPGADRINAGEEWLQTNTLDGQKAHDSFLRVGEPTFFQEFGPAGYHVSIGFANPKIINDRLAPLCSGDPTVGTTSQPCNNSITGLVTTERMSRTPDERLYSSGTNDSFSFTQCYVSVGDPDGADFAFTKCASDGSFNLSGLPNGTWRVTVFDQWNDMLVDGLSTPVGLNGGTAGTTVNMGDIATNQWQANIYTRTFFDTNGDGVSNVDAQGNPTEPGLTLVVTNNRFRDGSFSNFNSTDLNGNAGFNEVFPLFSWYVIETDTTRYKNTGTHVVYDAGGPADGSASCGKPGYPVCGTAKNFQNMANTNELVSIPAALRVPGAVYCANADCTGASIKTGPVVGGSSGPAKVSTGRIDPPWVQSEGWQGFSGQNQFIEFGKTPYAAGETGGIHGHVIYASTRPFDDPQLLLQLSWEPMIPHVTINLYQELTAPDNVTKVLHLVDTTQTSSWDDWAQGFRSDGNPNMNCPGQTTADLFYFTLFNQPMYLDAYSNGGTPAHTIPNNSEFKCYDGMHNWNQVQPAPYDGMYQFPSVTSMNPVSGKPVTTNCHVNTPAEPWGCVPDPVSASADAYRTGTPMLPPGKYVVEVVVPPGYELVKEEDKNILIGDTYIAPVAVEFPGLATAVYIMPDQAEVAALYNQNNAQNSTDTLGRVSTLPSHEGDTGSVETFWPCVGESRTVPDYISLFPTSGEVSPFAGATRNLCDRKEVTLDAQTSALAKFYLFTSTHVAAHFTGVITDDFTSEFDPFSPQFGEKFSPPNLPVSIKDWSGTEISRVYTDQWGTYNGLTYSTWEVNPPNPTGYAPQMMVTCMNDPGTGPTPDPLYNPQYSNFCYEIPFMPGQTQYMDTPVTPTSAFAGAGYNNPDCAYPDATPAVSEVDGDAIGPWVSAAGRTLTIQALGNQTVPNNAYSGPQTTTAPYNQKTLTRHYGFGATQGTGTVTIGGLNATVTAWSDTSITVTVPTGVPACAVQQQAIYGGSSAQCGELVITAGNGKQSIDAVSVTIGGKAPTHVGATASIQTAIDSAQPGDMLMIDPTTRATSLVPAVQAVHEELLLMWKPVRLQGVGAVASIINANTHPAGKLDPWRRQVNCLFGLSINGTPITASNPFSTTGFTCPAPMQFAIDRLPLEATVGWDASLNGNLAEQLQEPSLMGAYEGAAITVLGKGVKFPAGSNPFGADTFPVGTLLLKGGDCLQGTGTSAKNPFPSNFLCNPASIDGVGITNSSQGGGGVFVHGWAHNLQIANNRIYNNSGTLSGGISIGQGEFPGAYQRNGATPNADPGSCNITATGGTLNVPTNTQEPYCFNLFANVHNNAVMLNSSLGDELFSSTPSGAGGVAFCTGADYYKFQFNWVCGNLSTGDGGGLAHLGFSYNGDIEHNQILFNQSTNPTVPTNGGGLAVLGAPDTDPVCGNEAATPDADCAPGTSDGTGPGLVINANLFMGNSADSGSGGAMRFHGVNGTELTFFPSTPANWYTVLVTNNIVANNVAGWDGAGVSLQDALAVNVINNTVVSNDTTASAGILFNTLGAPLSSSPGTNCIQTGSSTTSCPQPAGLVAIANSPTLVETLTGRTLSCPTGHANCKLLSNPLLDNNVFWQNRSYYIGVGALSAAFQQNIVTLFNSFGTTPAPNQPQTDATTANGTGVIITGGTGACTAASYWDIGVRGDTGPTNHGSGFTLAPTYSVLTNTTGYTTAGLNNTALNPTLLSQYCNGSRTPPELASAGWQVPPGIADATVPNPPFTLTPAATVDEGNNWVNMSWGPLALTNPVTNAVLANYGPASTSSVINYIPSTAGAPYTSAPATDFYGTQRKTNNAVDAGAVEFTGTTTGTAIASVTGGPLAFGSVLVGTTSAAQTLTLHNTGTANLTGITVAVTAPFARAGGTCGATQAPGTCTITVVFSPTAVGAATGTVTITANVAVTGSPVALTGTGAAATRTATVTPSPLAFGNWATGTTSNTRNLTVHNSGNTALAGGTFTFGAATPFSRITTGAFPAGAPNCGATLAVNANCTIKVVFAPTAVTTYNGTLTVAYTGATVTPTPAALTGSGVAARAAVTITAPTITLATGVNTGTGTVTFRNTAAATGAQVSVTAVAVTGGSATTYVFTASGANTCTGAAIAPGATCTVGVRFTNMGSARGTDRTGTITFTDTGAGSPQVGTLTGHANP